MIQKWEKIGGLQLACCIADGLCRVTLLIAHVGRLSLKSLFKYLFYRSTIYLTVRTKIPFNLNAFHCGFGMPECIRDDSDSGPADRDHFFHPLDLHGFSCVKAQQLATKNRTLVDRGNKHIWQLQINAVYLPACHFSNRIVNPVH